MESINKKQQDLEKGCGEQYYDTTFKDVNKCDGNSRDGLCPECLAELKGIRFAKEEILKEIEKLNKNARMQNLVYFGEHFVEELKDKLK